MTTNWLEMLLAITCIVVQRHPQCRPMSSSVGESIPLGQRWIHYYYYIIIYIIHDIVFEI